MKHPVTRAAHYLFLVPFLPALQPLLVDFQRVDLAIYLAGIGLVVSLVIYANHRPLVRARTGGLSLYLHYRHGAEYHPYSGVTGYVRLSPIRIAIHSEDHHPVVLTMKRVDVTALAELLETENIHEIRKTTSA